MGSNAGAVFWAGCALFRLGLMLRWYSIIYLGRFFTVNVAIHSGHEIIDTGPYRYIRHPSYTGALLAFLGLALTLANWVSLASSCYRSCGRSAGVSRSRKLHWPARSDRPIRTTCGARSAWCRSPIDPRLPDASGHAPIRVVRHPEIAPLRKGFDVVDGIRRRSARPASHRHSKTAQRALVEIERDRDVGGQFGTTSSARYAPHSAPARAAASARSACNCRFADSLRRGADGDRECRQRRDDGDQEYRHDQRHAALSRSARSWHVLRVRAVQQRHGIAVARGREPHRGGLRSASRSPRSGDTESCSP